MWNAKPTLYFILPFLRPGPTDRWAQGVCKKRHNGRPDESFEVGVIRFHSLQKLSKICEICENGWKRIEGMALRRGYRVQFQSRRWTDEPDAICMPNVNTGVKCYKYETHKLTSFYVRATNDVYTFHVPYLSSLSHFLGQDEAERIPQTILTNDNGHTSFVAFICCRLTS